MRNVARLLLLLLLDEIEDLLAPEKRETLATLRHGTGNSKWQWQWQWQQAETQSSEREWRVLATYRLIGQVAIFNA